MTSISAERHKLAEVGMRLRHRGEWHSNFDYTNARAVDEPADHQFVHISVTNPGNYSSNDAHARAIEAIGKLRFPATGISYNRLILPDGHPYEGQPIGRRGAHTVNDDERATCNTAGCPSIGRSLRAPNWNLNYNARGYVMARNCGDAVTDADITAMARCLAADRLAGFVRRTATLHGHRCCSAKSCPCNPTWGLMARIESRMNHYLAQGNVSPEEPMPTPDEIADAVWTEKRPDDGGASANPPFSPGGPDGTQRHLATLLLKIRGDIHDIKVDVEEIKKRLGTAPPPGTVQVGSFTPAALADQAKANVDEQARRLVT
ncbi:MAG TPA: N-acetylmuramoyl-L-alanine amidase [Actinomycetes bacterium]|nr:N-acetylmuramoyl-L-alanine amidase [Actinomycetes bacterium]